jgi:hypothetical protein
VSFSFGHGGGYGGYYQPSSYVYVHSHDFLCDHVRSYAVPHSQVNTFVNQTKIINNNIRIENNVVVNRGPDVRYVERETRTPHRRIPIERTRGVRDLESRGISRNDMRVIDRSGGRARALRAAEPEPASRPLPSGRGGSDRVRGADERGRDVGQSPRAFDQDRGRVSGSGRDGRFERRQPVEQPGPVILVPSRSGRAASGRAAGLLAQPFHARGIGARPRPPGRPVVSSAAVFRAVSGCRPASVRRKRSRRRRRAASVSAPDGPTRAACSAA